MNPLSFLRPAAPMPVKDPAPACSVAEREAVQAEIATEHAAWADTRPRLERRTRELADRVDGIRALLRDAEQAHGEADAARLTASLAHGQRVARLEQRLRLGASESIDRFVAELLVLEETTRASAEFREIPGPLDPVTSHRPVTFVSNQASVERRLAAIQRARQAAEVLRLAPLAEAEVLARLRALADDLPEVEGLDTTLMVQLSPAARRAIEWHAEDSRKRRWDAGRYE